MQLRHASWKNEYSDDVTRFVKAHENMYDTALTEILNGRKRSHWMWFIFPQLKGLGRSAMSEYYGIDGESEAREYLTHPVLGNRLREISEALADLDTNDAHSVFGSPDDMKLRSSMTLFDAIEPNSIFNQVLAKFYKGRRDKKTLAILNNGIHF